MSNVADPFGMAGWKFRMERAYTPSRLPPDAPRRPPFKGGLGQVTGGRVPLGVVQQFGQEFLPIYSPNSSANIPRLFQRRLAPRSREILYLDGRMLWNREQRI